MSLRDVVNDAVSAGPPGEVVEDVPARAADALSSAGFGELAGDLLHTLLGHYATSAPMDQADVLAPIVTRTGVVPFDEDIDVLPGAPPDAHEPDDVDPADLLDEPDDADAGELDDSDDDPDDDPDGDPVDDPDDDQDDDADDADGPVGFGLGAAQVDGGADVAVSHAPDEEDEADTHTDPWTVPDLEPGDESDPWSGSGEPDGAHDLDEPDDLDESDDGFGDDIDV